MSQTFQNIRRNTEQQEQQGAHPLAALNNIPFPDLLEQSRDAVMKALPKHLGADRIMRIALTAFRRNTALESCAPLSVLSAVIQASQLGLEIGQNGEAFLVPYKKECQLIPGYKGLMKLVRQSGHVLDIYAQEVRQADFFKMSYGLQRELIHEPLFHEGGFPATDEERGDVTGFYAVAVLPSGLRTFTAMSIHQVNKIRDESSGYQFALANRRATPWIDQYVAMGLKTVLRSLCGKLPMSSDMHTALALDTAANLGVSQGLTLSQAADGAYEPPSFQSAYESQQMAARNQATPHQAPPAAPHAPRPSAMPRPSARMNPAPAQAPAAAPERAPAQEPAKAAPSAPPQAAAPAVKPSAKQQQAPTPLQSVEAKMRAVATEVELNALYLEGQKLCSGREIDELNFAYERALTRIEETTTDMFPTG